MRVFYPTDPMDPQEWILSISELDGVSYPWRLVVTSGDTIAEVKAYYMSWTINEWYEDEVDLILRRDIPYPLKENMKVGELREEHRLLFLIHRPPPSNALPLRYLRKREDGSNGLDFSRLREQDLPLVNQWLSFFPSWIRIDTDLPWTLDVLYALGEQIRSFPVIPRIEWRGKQSCQDGFTYVRYHAAMDQYRDGFMNKELFYFIEQENPSGQ